jgi:hypothetical protein
MTQRMAIRLTLLNLALLVVSLTRSAGFPAAARAATPEVAPLIRARVLELLDERGQVRSRLNVEPDGEVVLRLLDRTGAIRVKLGAGDGGSGLVLLDETTEPGVHVVARRRGTSAMPATTSLSLRGADGERVIRP